MLRVLRVESQVLVKGHPGVLHETLLTVGLALPINRIQLVFEARELLNLSAYFIASLLEFHLFLREQVSLLIDALLDTLQGHLAADTQRVTLKDILAPLHPIPFDVRQELLEEHAFIIKLLFLLFLNW